MRLHVQAANEAALRFYTKHGFTVVQQMKDYYTELPDKDCYVLEKEVV